MPYASLLHQAAEKMIAIDAGDPRRIQHFVKVCAFAGFIAEGEGLDPQTRFILEMAAIFHDAGIHACEEKYHSTAGRYQEMLGPGIARPVLEELALPADIIDRVCYLIAHHHTYTDVDGLDYRILLEADFLVNLYEDAMSPAQIRSARSVGFRTATGLALLDAMFPLMDEAIHKTNEGEGEPTT